MDERARSFWRDAFALDGSVTLQVSRRVLVFGLFALLLCVLDPMTEPHLGIEVEHFLGIGIAPYEVAGAALGLLLVLRTNSGYDRWWEGRRLWGGIVNESRNLAIAGLAYGPDDADWRSRFVRWTAVYPHAVRHCLRNERTVPKIVALLGPETAESVATAEHLPSFVALRIAEILQEGLERPGVDRYALMQAEQSRVLLIDYAGGCERIRKAPLPRSYAINIRRFIVLFLATMPFALLAKVGRLTPIVTIFVAYPMLSLDEIGHELQNPFLTRNIDHLPLDDICATIEANVLALIGTTSVASVPACDAESRG
jgi:putative membrane protein